MVDTTTIAVDLPSELVDLLGSPAAPAARARQSLVLDLLRDADITHGQAAHLLGVRRSDTLDLIARDQIPSGPVAAEEAEQDLAAARWGARLAESSVRR